MVTPVCDDFLFLLFILLFCKQSVRLFTGFVPCVIFPFGHGVEFRGYGHRITLRHLQIVNFKLFDKKEGLPFKEVLLFDARGNLVAVRASVSHK